MAQKNGKAQKSKRDRQSRTPAEVETPERGPRVHNKRRTWDRHGDLMAGVHEDRRAQRNEEQASRRSYRVSVWHYVTQRLHASFGRSTCENTLQLMYAEASVMLDVNDEPIAYPTYAYTDENGETQEVELHLSQQLLDAVRTETVRTIVKRKLRHLPVQEEDWYAEAAAEADKFFERLAERRAAREAKTAEVEPTSDTEGAEPGSNPQAELVGASA